MKSKNKIVPIRLKHFTPGPWREDDGHVFQSSNHFDNRESICHVYDYDDNFGICGTSNSVLIAAAPDLLEKLKKCYLQVINLELRLELLETLTHAMSYPWFASAERLERINKTESYVKKLEFIKEWENELKLHEKYTHFCNHCQTKRLESEIEELTQINNKKEEEVKNYCKYCNNEVEEIQ